MAYSYAALERRACIATCKDGEPCRAFAMWGDGRQLCTARRPRPHGSARAGTD
jgi:hypothetical protein